MIWIYNLLTLSQADEGYSRNMLYAPSYLSRFLWMKSLKMPQG